APPARIEPQLRSRPGRQLPRLADAGHHRQGGRQRRRRARRRRSGGGAGGDEDGTAAGGAPGGHGEGPGGGRGRYGQLRIGDLPDRVCPELSRAAPFPSAPTPVAAALPPPEYGYG